MASPPAGSPPGPSPLALPRQRPLQLALPTKPRKSSLAPSTGSAHPLRQTSFPPSDSLEAQHRRVEDGALSAYSPAGSELGDGFSDSEITSAISGNFGDDALNAGKKRKRAEKKVGGGRGGKRTVRMGSVSIANGDDGRSTTGNNKRGTTAGAGSVVAGEGEEDEEEDDDDDDAANGGGGEAEFLNAAELDRDSQRRFLFRETVKSEHQNRYDSWNQVRLGKAEVRRLVNATLSQSVPANVVSAVQAYSKLFAGILIESARDVQAEWMACAPKGEDGEENRAVKRLKVLRPYIEEEHDEEEDGDGEHDTDQQNGEKANGASLPNGTALPDHGRSLPSGNHVKTESRDSSLSPDQALSYSDPASQVNGLPKDDTGGAQEEVEALKQVQPGAWGLSNFVDEYDRGPLLPDHLREALRRYKHSRAGGVVGLTGISMGRTDVVAPRLGGKRLFR